MNKSEIQSRIEKCESELAALKADLAKCDCAEEIEEEKCWHALGVNGYIYSDYGLTKTGVLVSYEAYRPAYMPECRQVTAEDAINASSAYLKTGNSEEMARKLHKLGFRMKVTP